MLASLASISCFHLILASPVSGWFFCFVFEYLETLRGSLEAGEWRSNRPSKEYDNNDKNVTHIIVKWWNKLGNKSQITSKISRFWALVVSLWFKTTILSLLRVIGKGKKEYVRWNAYFWFVKGFLVHILLFHCYCINIHTGEQ